MSPATLQEDRHSGVIATLTDGSVWHMPGSKREAMLGVAAICDIRGVKVRTISTAQTIATDLQGHRQRAAAGRGHDATYGETPAIVSVPEPYYCGMIGRRDLLSREELGSR